MIKSNILNGLSLTELGMGGAPLGNLYEPIAEADAKAVARVSYEAGFRYFDTAPFYGFGLSERRIGDVLREYPKDSFVLSSKVGRILKPVPGHCGTEVRHGYASPMPFEPLYDYSYDGIMRSHETSLQRLGLPRIDILYVHDIGTVTHGAENDRHFRDLADGGYKALDELRSCGDVSAIGLGVNEWQVCEDAMGIGQWDCFLLAGRYSLLEQSALNSFFPKCEGHGARLILGGIYNSGILATGTKRDGVVHYDYGPAPVDIIAKVRKIEAICAEYDVSLPAAALQFALAHPLVVSVIPGLGQPKRVQQTIGLYGERIPAAFWQQLVAEGLIDERAPLPKGDA